jgi:hypothetical protein
MFYFGLSLMLIGFITSLITMIKVIKGTISPVVAGFLCAVALFISLFGAIMMP